MPTPSTHNQSIQNYLASVSNRFQNGISSEHSYRGDLEGLIRQLAPHIDITNEPSKITDCGNPDYVLVKNQIPIGFIEAKDIGKDLNSKTYKEQFSRYRKALDNLIITDYVWFQFFQHGEKVHEIRIADIADGKLQPCPQQFEHFISLIQDFCSYTSQTIKSPKKLAEMMAAKARLLENILEQAVTSDEKTQDNTALQQQYKTFKNILIHDLTPHDFADIYAQTLAYGMFAARLHDTTLDTFSRQEAAELIPKTNPFLRKLFAHVAGPDIDERIKTTVDNLAEVFRATNVEQVLKNFGKATQTHDPIIHFYETFLAAYDPKLRKSRGVWYTPEPVVSFIVRSVDELLKSEFGLKDGLADTSKTTIKLKTDKRDNRTQSGYVEREKSVHKVQVLDPATGTGTFLAEVIKFIYHKKFKAMQGAWSGYVENDLIPRLNGFELLMASYSMAHLKLDMLLAETGVQVKNNQRFNIFLTNSLEEHHPDTGTLFASWLSSEASEANRVKRDTPVMVIMGNPPYAVSSTNKSDWIQDLLKDYKKDLNERNIQPLSDDYIKFIRYGQHFIDKNGEGILAYISNNSFIDGVIHRQMRKHLLESFDSIYILDLHGNSKKKETAPDGSKDENVFDIMQGVSINIFVKSKLTHTVTPAQAGVHQSKMDSRLRGNDKKLAKVYHLDAYGKRQTKYDLLNENTLADLSWAMLETRAPEYFLVPRNYEVQEQYQEGFSVNDIFSISSVGIGTYRDHFVIDMDKKVLQNRMQCFCGDDLNDEQAKVSFNLKETSSWLIAKARQGLMFSNDKLKPISYRPFDTRHIYYDSALIDRGREQFMQHFLEKENTSISIIRRDRGNTLTTPICANLIVDKSILSTLDNANIYPLYLYPETEKQKILDENLTRKPNLDAEIVATISKGLGLEFEVEQSGDADKFAPIDLLDYIYAVLHSPHYRETYKEFLKIDFPHIPYPKDKAQFESLVKLGSELRQIHLLESPVVENFITSYPHDGDNAVTRKINKKDWELTDTDTGRIWINDQQCFDCIPLKAWEFYIGGYQPAQKWLKDRHGRTLSYDDVLHYQKIIVALTKTDHLMQAIDTAWQPQ